jgi:hypothetical protein
MEIRSSKYSFAALRQELNIQRKAIRAEVTKRSKAEFGQLQEKQEEIWIANGELARSPGHPFYQRLNDLLDSGKFDLFVEGLCRKFYAPRMGRPSLAPGIYFRSLLIGYFEGIDSERGIAWRPGRLPGAAAVCAHLAHGVHAGSFDDFADTAADRRGDAPGGVRLGGGACWRMVVC